MAEKKGGLRDIVAARSEICFIDGQQGILLFRGYDINDLAKHCSFEEVAYLVLRGELPSNDELAALKEELAENRVISGETCDVVDMAAKDAAPMEMLRTAVSATSFDDPDKDSNSEEASQRKALRLTAKLPTIIARYERRRRELEPIDPDPDLDYAANFLTMLRGEQPTEEEARVFDVAMLLHVDHDMNASTFTARVIASTLSDLYSAVVGAIGALKGPLHGGANSDVMNMLERIGSIDRVEEEVRGIFGRKEKLPGHGHPVYRTFDPRARILKEFSHQLSEEASGDEPNWFEMSEKIEKLAFELKGLYPNVDFYSASTYHYLGIPTDLFTTLFAASRVVGWSANVIEQHRDNRIIRPTSEYVGPAQREFPALSQRP